MERKNACAGAVVVKAPERERCPLSQAMYQKLLDLIEQRKVTLEIYRVKNASVFKRIWFQFAYAYIRFRAVRNFDFFQQVYKSEIVRLRLVNGEAIAYPFPWHTIFQLTGLRNDVKQRH